MSTKTADRSGVRDEIERRLARAGQRWTKGRRAVIEVFEESSMPLSAIELHAKVGPSVSLSSLYRIVGDLVDAKVLIKLEFSEGFARFEFNIGLMQDHHHLVCTECGSVIDLELHDLATTLSHASRGIKRRVGFVVQNHRLDFFGLCKNCAKRLK